MDLLKSETVGCPYCGETLSIDIDCSIEFQQYVEDCQVCCRPINVTAGVGDDGEVNVTVRHEDD